MTRESHGNIEFLNGEVIGFECFFKECFAKYNAFASRFVDDVFVREDVVQEAFVAAWSNRSGQFESELGLHSFMYKMMDLDEFVDYETRAELWFEPCGLGGHDVAGIGYVHQLFH